MVRYLLCFRSGLLNATISFGDTVVLLLDIDVCDPTRHSKHDASAPNCRSVSWLRRIAGQISNLAVHTIATLCRDQRRRIYRNGALFRAVVKLNSTVLSQWYGSSDIRRQIVHGKAVFCT